jgi:hypothetical protein
MRIESFFAGLDDSLWVHDRKGANNDVAEAVPHHFAEPIAYRAVRVRMYIVPSLTAGVA